MANADEAKLRAWWWHKQGLDGRLDGHPPADVLQQTGWARSVGGVGPYLTLFSRAAIGRQQADDAVAKLQIHELPSARGCTYVVPQSDFALALTVGQGFDTEINTARKLGVTDAEIDKLCERVLKALSKGPLEPDAIREAAGAAARSLGEEGKKKGLTTTLPVALGRLQSEGDIRRVPVNGRLDQQRYKYAAWHPGPLAASKLSKEQGYTELARRYFSWIGPATVTEFQWFSGLGVKAAKAAIEPLKLVPLKAGDERLLLPDVVEALASYKPPVKPHYNLVSSLDGISLLRRSAGELVAPADRGKGPLKNAAKPGSSLGDFPDHAILDRGRLVGLWEYDTQAGEIAWMSFEKADSALKAAIERTQKFIADDLGDARSFSLDSPKSRAPKIAALRAAKS